jgi:hypothetical protein
MHRKISSSMKNHYMEGIGCRGRFSLLRRIIISKELGAEEVFLFYEESLLEKNWVQRKVLFYEKKESLLGRNLVKRKNFLSYGYEESLYGRNWV